MNIYGTLLGKAGSFLYLLVILTVFAFLNACTPSGTIRPESTSSQSIGKPNNGRLSKGVQFQPRSGIRLNNPDRSWGTSETVSLLNYAFDAMLTQYPNTCDMFIGDISKKRGGRLYPHKSHQSGRDVDVGLYAKGNKFVYFINFNEKNLDIPKTWYLIETLLETGRVRLILVDTSIQKLFYNYLKPVYSKRKLDKYLQYPRSRNIRKGIIRHAPGHKNHLHIRFKCSEEDSRCVEW